MPNNELKLSKWAERKRLLRALLEPYVQARKDFTAIRQYARLEPGPDSRIRTEPNPIGTSTIRFSSAEFPLDQYSTNLQNLPKKTAAIDPIYAARDIIVADPGYLLFGADFMGAEALLGAAYQADWKTFDMIMSGRNIHKYHMSIFFDIPEEEADKKSPLYTIVKNVHYGGQYMASVWKLTTTINKEAEWTGIRVTQAQVAEAYNKWLQVHPVEQWWQKTKEELEAQNNRLWNCFGYRRGFLHPDSMKRLKAGLAFYPQSTVGSAIRRAMRRIDKELDDGDEFLQVMQIHDEIFGQVREDRADQYLPALVRILEEPFELNDKEIYIPADVSVGERWGRMEAWKAGVLKEAEGGSENEEEVD